MHPPVRGLRLGRYSLRTPVGSSHHLLKRVDLKLTVEDLCSDGNSSVRQARESKRFEQTVCGPLLGCSAQLPYSRYSASEYPRSRHFASSLFIREVQIGGCFGGCSGAVFDFTALPQIS